MKGLSFIHELFPGIEADNFHAYWFLPYFSCLTPVVLQVHFSYSHILGLMIFAIFLMSHTYHAPHISLEEVFVYW